MELKEIRYGFPRGNYISRVLTVRSEGGAIFDGMVHMSYNMDCMELGNDIPLRLEKGGSFYELPRNWQKAICISENRWQGPITINL